MLRPDLRGAAARAPVRFRQVAKRCAPGSENRATLGTSRSTKSARLSQASAIISSSRLALASAALCAASRQATAWSRNSSALAMGSFPPSSGPDSGITQADAKLFPAVQRNSRGMRDKRRRLDPAARFGCSHDYGACSLGNFGSRELNSDRAGCAPASTREAGTIDACQDSRGQRRSRCKTRLATPSGRRRPVYVLRRRNAINAERETTRSFSGPLHRRFGWIARMCGGRFAEWPRNCP